MMPESQFGKTRQVKLICICIAITTTLLVYFAGIGPAIDRHRDFQTLTGELATRQQESTELINIQNRLRRRSDELASRILEVDQTFRNEDQLNERVAEVIEVAGSYEINVASVRSLRSRKLDGFDEIRVTINGTAKYASIVSFMRKSHEESMDLHFSGFEFTADHQNRPDILDFEIVLDWYAVSADEPDATQSAVANGTRR